MIDPRCLPSHDRRLRRCRGAGKKPKMGLLCGGVSRISTRGVQSAIGPKAYRKFKDNFAIVLIVFA
jgi:hypothetical protein